jgi:hypothetical protein
METAPIQKRVDQMAAAMLRKGLRSPEATFELRSDSEAKIVLTSVKLGATSNYDRDYHIVRSNDDIGALLDTADAYVVAMPSGEERKLRDFMTALDKVIDLGRVHGIDTAFTNPLLETARRLAENIITHQPGEAC